MLLASNFLAEVATTWNTVLNKPVTFISQTSLISVAASLGKLTQLLIKQGRADKQVSLLAYGSQRAAGLWVIIGLTHGVQAVRETATCCKVFNCLHCFRVLKFLFACLLVNKAISK